MKKNISRYTQLDNTILMEYIINNEYQNYDSDSTDVDMLNLSQNEAQLLFIKPTSNINTGLLYFDNNGEDTKNSYKHLALPLDKSGSEWIFCEDKEYINNYLEIANYNSSISRRSDIYNKSNYNIAYDTIRLHIISGYSFNDIYGILIQVSTLNDDGNIINLANWLYKDSDREYVYEKPIIINNKVFDKYIEFKIPSIQFIRGIEYDESIDDDIMRLKKELNLKENNISNISICYSFIEKDVIEKEYDEDINNKKEIGFKFTLSQNLYLQIPYNSQSDNFNLFLEEATDGDYFNYYTTWCDYPLNSSIVSMFNTKIKLYESKNVNELYDSIYDEREEKSNWIVIHELTTSFYGYPNENNKVSKVLPDENYSITQEFENFEYEKNVFKYKPIISDNINANLISNIFINYTAKLINRIDGTQIVRHGSLTTNNIRRYVTTLDRLNTKNFNNYSVYNKIIKEETKLNNKNSLIKNRYVKVFYNVNDIVLDSLNGEMNSGTIKFLKSTSTYKFVFKLKDENGKRKNIDLSDLNTYALVYRDITGKENQIYCTFSSNMNLMNGELEFNLTKNHIEKMMNSDSNYFDIVIYNADGSMSTLFESYYDI